MPHWDEPSLTEERSALVREIDAARRLCDVLPARSRDRAMVERTIEYLERRLADLAQSDGVDPVPL